MSNLPISIIEHQKASSTDAHKSTPCDSYSVGRDSSALTDSRIAELLAAIDQVAIDYGSMAYGLPTHVPAIREQMFEAVRMWLAKGKK